MVALGRQRRSRAGTSGDRSRSCRRLRRSPLIASIESGQIYQVTGRWQILLVLCFAQNKIEIWKRWKFRDQHRGLNQLGKIDILRLWQLRCARAHDYHLPCAEWSSLAGMMFERDAAVTFEDDEFDP